MDLEIILIFITLVFSGFFSGMEIAFISANKLHIEIQKEKSGFSGRILSKFSENRAQFLATTLVGNNLALVFYGILMASKLDPVITGWDLYGGEITVLILQTMLSTALVLLTAEFLPKSIFLINPDVLLSLFAIPMNAIYWTFKWPVRLIVITSKFFITKFLGMEYSEDKPVFGLTDLNNYIKKTFGEGDSNQSSDVEVDTDLFSNAIEFKSVRVRECMIPRTEVVALDVQDPIDELKSLFIESGHSKIVIYKETIDDVIGYCHSLELFKKPKDIKSIMNPIIIVPETMPANELMVQFITERKSLALVVDEYGGTSGIVSMEDIIEEIFGEIQDEHDDEYLTEEQMDDTNFLLSARHEVDYLNEKYEWGLPEGDYDTLGGLILEFNENIPSKNDVIEIPPFTFTIFSMADNRIDNVKLTLADLENSNTE
ncbi:MAG: hemolysin family protein [bacterium]|nr:hemolysin family protein [bacterium]